MFKLLSISFVIVTVVFAADEKYTTKYDNINLKDILESDRLLNNYVNCLKGTGKCTPDGSELKRKFKKFDSKKKKFLLFFSRRKTLNYHFWAFLMYLFPSEYPLSLYKFRKSAKA